MKSIITLSAVEVSALNDLLGTYGSEHRIKESCGVTHGISVSGVFLKEGAYVLTVEVPMLLELCKIAMDHAKPIKGLIKTLSGLKETAEYIARNISRDVRNLMRKYDKDE